MEIKDLAGLSEPLCKLIDTFQNGCSFLFKPLQIKRIASVSSEVTSMENNVDLKKRLKEALLEDTFNATHSIREKRQFENVASIYASAAQELQMIDHVDDTPVDPDWCTRFFDYSKDVSNEDAQIIWAKILAGEIAQPGSFYKRTLSVLRDIEAFEAKWFADMCQFVICNSIVEMSLLKYYPYSQIQSLMDCGLLNSVACESSLTEKATEINGKSHSLKIISSQIDLTMIRFRDVFRLTDAGTQLYNITQVQTHKSYMIGLKEQLEIKYGLVLELVQISQ